MESRRSGSRLKKKSYKSIFTNDISTPINIEEDDFVSPPGRSSGKIKASNKGKEKMVDIKNDVYDKKTLPGRKMKVKTEKCSKMKKKQKTFTGKSEESWIYLSSQTSSQN